MQRLLTRLAANNYPHAAPANDAQWRANLVHLMTGMDTVCNTPQYNYGAYAALHAERHQPGQPIGQFHDKWMELRRANGRPNDDAVAAIEFTSALWGPYKREVASRVFDSSNDVKAALELFEHSQKQIIQDEINKEWLRKHEVTSRMQASVGRMGENGVHTAPAAPGYGTVKKTREPPRAFEPVHFDKPEDQYGTQRPMRLFVNEQPYVISADPAEEKYLNEPEWAKQLRLAYKGQQRREAKTAKVMEKLIDAFGITNEELENMDIREMRQAARENLGGGIMGIDDEGLGRAQAQFDRRYGEYGNNGNYRERDVRREYHEEPRYPYRPKLYDRGDYPGQRYVQKDFPEAKAPEAVKEDERASGKSDDILVTETGVRVTRRQMEGPCVIHPQRVGRKGHKTKTCFALFPSLIKEFGFSKMFRSAAVEEDRLSMSQLPANFTFCDATSMRGAFVIQPIEENKDEPDGRQTFQKVNDMDLLIYQNGSLNGVQTKFFIDGGSSRSSLTRRAYEKTIERLQEKDPSVVPEILPSKWRYVEVRDLEWTDLGFSRCS